MNNPTSQKSIYRRGADDGFWFGLYLSVLFIALVSSISSALAGLAFFVMAVAVPVIIYFLLRRSYRSDNCRSMFSALWLHGICIFFFGSLLMALTAYIYLRFIDPTYIVTLVDTAHDMYVETNTPEAQQMAAILQRVKDSHMLPTTGEIAVQIIWAGVFSGSMLSMIMAAIVRATTRPTPPAPPTFQPE